MPALHDQSFAYESVTTDGGLTIPMCDYAAGMLMFITLVGDTGTPTVGVTGSPATWNQLFQRVNTCSTTVLWRYATASEPDVVLTASVAETYSGELVVWRDVYQGYTVGSPPVFSQTTSTGTQIALPTITTSAADSIVMGLVSGAGASSFAFLESILQELVKVDGAAEGFGSGWFYKRSVGVTTAYNVASLSSQAGTKAVIEIRAPAGGATEFPTYPVSDASILLSPQPGIAWDSNTAMAATADTNFGTTIAGKTCNDATIATVQDIGIDVGSFMSFAGLTNVASATAISGAEAVMAAARYNVGNRNILSHFRHPTPINNQKLSPLKSGRGIWAGMRSGATAGANWKVWQVHGADVKISPGSPQPIVINAANTDTIATNGTLSNSDVRGYGFWVSGLGALTNQACFGPMWAMDTTVLAGGTSAANPMADVYGGAQIAPWTGMTLEKLAAAQVEGGFNEANGNFTWVVNNTGSGNLNQCVAFLDALAQTDNDIDSGALTTTNGKRVGTWYTYNASGQIVTRSGAGDGKGLFIEAIPTADEQRIVFTDDAGNLKTRPFNVSISVDPGSYAIADTLAWYHGFFLNGPGAGDDFNTSGAITVRDSADVQVKGNVAANASGGKLPFAFDYDGDTWGGIAGTNKDVVMEVEGDGGATAAKTVFTISRTAIINVTCAPGLETNQ